MTDPAPQQRAAPTPQRGPQGEESPFKKFFGIAQVCDTGCNGFRPSDDWHLELPAILHDMDCNATGYVDTELQLLVTTANKISVTKFFVSKPPATPPPIPSSEGSNAEHLPVPAIPTQAYPVWPLGIPLAMHVYLSTSPNGDVFSSKWTSGYRENQDADLPHFVWDNITFGDWSDIRTVEYDVHLPPVSK